MRSPTGRIALGGGRMKRTCVYPVSVRRVGGIRNSQLSCIGERKRRHPPRVLVEDQRARDRGFGALAAVFAFAKPAVDAERRALGLIKIHAGGVDQLGGVTDFATEADR